MPPKPRSRRKSHAQPLWGRPALLLRLPSVHRPARYLVASELHLGLESDLARRGAYLRSRTLELAEALERDADAARAQHLLLLGDVKHRYTHTSAQESRDVPRFFERLAKRFQTILITPGNHDTGLRRLLPSRRFPSVRIGNPRGELLEGNGLRVGALHGHTWPRPPLLRADLWLVGHTHAAAALVDESGRSTTEWAWLRGRLDPARVHAKYGRRAAPELVVFPPYNPLCGGTPINRDGLLGPVGRLAHPAQCALWLLDGRRLMDLADHPLSSRRRPGGASD